MLVEGNFEDHFGPLHTEAPLVHDEVTLQHAIPLRTAARFAGTDETELIILNPALSELVREGRASIPRNYKLRVPSGSLGNFMQAYTPWQAEEKARLAALKLKRKTKLASSKKGKKHTRKVAKRSRRKTTKKRAALRAKSAKRSSVREAQAIEKSRKPQG